MQISTSSDRPATFPRRHLIALAATALLSSPAIAQLRVVNYNIAQLNGDVNDMEDAFIEMHADATRGFAVPVSVFVFQECKNANFTTLTFRVNDAAPPGVFYSPATYTNQGEDFVGAQAAFYRDDLLTEDQSGHVDLLTGGSRASDRWLFRLKVSDLVEYDNPDGEFYLYSSHLKAGSSSSDIDDREDGVDVLRVNADALGANAHILYTGDMNFGSNAEPGFLRFFAAGSGQAVDPLGGGPWSGSGNAVKHTQSPRTINTGGLISGGMDDRFDFQLHTSNWVDGSGFEIISGTYRAFGNDGQHFDSAINSGNNFYFPGELLRSNALANDLHDASDHIPVIVDYAIPPALEAFVPPVVGRVIEGGNVDVPVLIRNNAPVDVVQGGSDMAYTIIGASGLSGFINGTAPPLGPFIPVNLTLDTSVAGPINAMVLASSTTPGTHNASEQFSVTATVVRTSDASFDNAIDQNALVIADTQNADSGIANYTADIFNLGFDSTDNQALLDIDSVGSVAAPFSYAGGDTTGIGLTPATLSFDFDTAGLAPGLYEEIVTIMVSDEDLTGETMSQITLTLQVTVEGIGLTPCPWDCSPDNGDGTFGNNVVNIDDLLEVINTFGASGGPCDNSPDNGDGTFGNNVVNIDDLLGVINNFGDCP
ncbi:MAG: hypothetical protein AAF432_01600 [Planctomycetota bacterium]